jgi:hypothetical protein
MGRKHAARRARAVAFLAGLYLIALPRMALAVDCSGLPTSFTGNEFPSGDFFRNFNNPCYMVPLGVGHGNTSYGDLNATYFQAYFKVDPRYQLIVLGTFPNARYFTVTLYDAHSAYTQLIGDANIVPLTPRDVNPYAPGAAYVGGQRFAIPVNFGGAPGAGQTGCMMNGYNVDVNGLDGTRRHAGMDWNSDLGMFQAYPHFVNHIVDTPRHGNPNTAGALMIRAYLDITPLDYTTSPHIIVRDVASGCAYPAAYALNTLQIVTSYGTTGQGWLDATQNNAHSLYETTYLPKLCYGSPAHSNALSWLRQPQYVPGASPESAYIVANVPAGLPAALADAGEVMRIRFRLPAFPPTPCTDGCSRSGNEQMRYMSLSFLKPGGATLASLADRYFTQDANGYVTLIVGTGASIPSWIVAANGYTFFDLTAVPNYQQLNLLDLRHIAPAADFNCAGQFVPYRTTAAVPTGSLLGDYMPVVDYPLAATLPPVAAALVGPGGCAVFPPGQPGIVPNCGTFPPPHPFISGVVTQCPAPGCNKFEAQANPPVTVTGGGFGNFPGGMPSSGTSKYFQIRNSTRGWTAGSVGSDCTVSLHSWASNRIQLVANVNEGGRCPLAPGDQLTVTVWNPQVMTGTSFKVTVSASEW